MSYDAFSKNDGQNEGGSDLPQNNQNPYGGSSETPPNSPYSTPQTPQQGAPFSSPYAAPQASQQGYPQAPQQSGPYSFNQPPASPAPSGGFSIFGLTWDKNIIPNPATNGMAPSSQKSVPVAYILWFLFGAFGVHQFYLGNNSRGLFNLVLWAATMFVGLFLFFVPFLFTAYWIYEAVTLNDQTQEVNSGRIRKSIL